jgi:hypothetical protein
MIRFASPAWLALFALQAKGDADLPDGVHVRIQSSPLLGLPLAPWLVWQVPVSTIAVTTPRDPKLLKTAIPIEPPEAERDTTRYVAVEAVPPSGGKTAISLFDPDTGGLISRRSEPAAIVGGPVTRRVHLNGDIAGARLKVYAIYSKSTERIREDKPIATLPLPIPGDCRWYYGGITQKKGLDRVARGAPRRYTALDQPNGPFDPLVPDDEVARIEAQRAEVDAALEDVVRNPADAPWNVTLAVPNQGSSPPQSADVPQLDSVLMPICDPGFARYLGFADNIGKAIRRDMAKPLIGLVVSGVFAVDPQRVISEIQFGPFKLITRLEDRLPPLDADEQEMVDRVLDLTGAKDVANELRSKGFEIRCFTAAAGAVPTPDPLPAPGVSLTEANWIAAASGISTSFRQGFALSTTPFAPLLAMARDDGKGFKPRTRLIKTRTAPRHVVLLRGEDSAGHQIASDAPISSGAKNRYRFCSGDLFGRFGNPADIDVPDPGRPAPPPPVLRAMPLRAVLDDQAPGALSPGSLDVRVPVPDNSSIGIGGRPIATLMLSFAGETRTLAATPGTMIAQVFALPPLAPQQSGSWALTAYFVDDNGTSSPHAAQTINITDGRRPRPTPAGPGIIWTSRPGPSPDVELRLSWPAAPGQAYRAWIADQRGLDLPAAATRAAIALDGYTKQQQGQLNGRADRFRLITDTPITAGTDGRAHLATTLPRTLQTVGFLRIVPETHPDPLANLNACGFVQADFDACGLVPVAVPNDQRPPIPRLTLAVNAAGKPELMVEAVGFDLNAIAVAEPGLFAQPPTAANPPRYRLRRASGTVNDPLYARMVGGIRPLSLDRSDDAPQFAATFVDASALLPFVRYTWWAEVCLPAERRLPRGATMLPPPGAITAENTAQTEDAPAAFSLLSAPVTVVNAPTGAPAALNPASITATIAAATGGFVLQLLIADVPVAHPQAVGPYRIRLWAEQNGAAPVLLADAVPTTNPAFQWTGTVASNGATNIYVVVIDPLGRESPPTVKAVAS